MNRLIKFRGKDIKTGEWLYGDFVHASDGMRTAILVSDRESYDECETEPTTIGQYTGLKDRTGKEVYEGDVVFWIAIGTRGIGRGEQGAIIWDKNTMSWAILRDEPTLDGRPCIISRPFDRKHLEVIGNIYDNPELMKGERQSWI